MRGRQGRGRVRRRGGRGRGRGRGRGGVPRGRGGFVYKNDELLSNQYTVEGAKDESGNKNEDEKPPKDWSKATFDDMQNLFLTDHNISDHISAISVNRTKYIRNLHLFISYKIMLTVSTSTKAKILATLLIKNEKYEIEYLLKNGLMYSVGEIARCISILDAPRKARQMEKKLNRLKKLKEMNNKNVKDSTISKLKTKIHNFKVDKHNGSLNGCKVKILLKWLKSIDKEQLEFFLLSFGPDNWKLICDLLHPNPKDFQCKYFQDAIYDPSSIPIKSLVYQAKLVKKENLIELLHEYPYLSQCYSFLRKKLINNSPELVQKEGKIEQIIDLGFTRHEALCALTSNHYNVENSAIWLFEDNNKENCVNRNVNDPKKENEIPDEAKHLLTENAPLEDILWWYDELHSKESEMEIISRMKNALKKKKDIFNDNSPRSNYGKLMDRLLTFRDKKYKFVDLLIPFAEQRLQKIKVKNNSVKVAVFGDASGSMEVAIKSSCIIASLLSVSLNADLLFFNSQAFSPKVVPRNVKQTIEVVSNTQAVGGTCMAAPLYQYYIKKTKVDLFILVSDEGENEKYEGYYFASLFKKYRNEINKNCKLFLVSFVKVGENGFINEKLKNKGINDHQQFRLHPLNPDTSKFDALLGRIALMMDGMKYTNYLVTELLMKYYNDIFERVSLASSIADNIVSFV